MIVRDGRPPVDHPTHDAVQFVTSTLRAIAVVIAIASGATLVSACSPAPQRQLASLRQEASSWSAAARFAVESERAGSVPAAYVRQVASRGVEEVETIKTKIADVDVDTAQRAEAMAECDAIVNMLKQETHDAASTAGAVR
jgi:hypothetical protein